MVSLAVFFWRLTTLSSRTATSLILHKRLFITLVTSCLRPLLLVFMRLRLILILIVWRHYIIKIFTSISSIIIVVLISLVTLAWLLGLLVSFRRGTRWKSKKCLLLIQNRLLVGSTTLLGLCVLISSQIFKVIKDLSSPRVATTVARLATSCPCKRLIVLGTERAILLRFSRLNTFFLFKVVEYIV